MNVQFVICSVMNFTSIFWISNKWRKRLMKFRWYRKCLRNNCISLESRFILCLFNYFNGNLYYAPLLKYEVPLFTCAFPPPVPVLHFHIRLASLKCFELQCSKRFLIWSTLKCNVNTRTHWSTMSVERTYYYYPFNAERLIKTSRSEPFKN
jgi:hypothetical protein